MLDTFRRGGCKQEGVKPYTGLLQALSRQRLLSSVCCMPPLFCLSACTAWARTLSRQLLLVGLLGVLEVFVASCCGGLFGGWGPWLQLNCKICWAASSQVSCQDRQDLFGSVRSWMRSGVPLRRHDALSSFLAKLLGGLYAQTCCGKSEGMQGCVSSPAPMQRQLG